MKIGILGGGQLGRMIALAGHNLGLHFRVLDPGPDPPARWVSEWVQGAFDDSHVLVRFATGLDAITYEFENLPAESIRTLAQLLPVHPRVEALETSQERLLEKAFFQRLGIPTAPFAAVASEEDLRVAMRQLGLPAILKTRTQGYDGKGQLMLEGEEDAASAWKQLGGVPCILEGLVRFDREVSIIAVRGRDGATATYPLVENHHWKGMLRQSIAPAPRLTAVLQTQAEGYANKVLETLGYVGVLAIEFFDCGGKLVANEMAPRVHNSGHWTIEGAETSQFENHLRAVLGLPLGGTAMRGHACMLNLIGAVPTRESILAVEGAHLHLYGKQPFPMRKLGHVTLLDSDLDRLHGRLRQLRSSPEFSWLWPGQPWNDRV